jgi:hypothetical protein
MGIPASDSWSTSPTRHPGLFTKDIDIMRRMKEFAKKMEKAELLIHRYKI